MSRILTDEVVPGRRTSFLARQFAIERTRAQDNFDVAFGVVFPVVCFLFDPIIFKGGFILGGDPMLGEFQFFAYLVSAIEIAALLVWLILRRHLQSFTGPIAGVLLAGGIFSFAIGVLILPYSIIGLVVLIGAAGFTPFVTAFVYVRNAVCGLRSHENNSAFESRFLVATASALIAIALPLFVSLELSRTVSTSMESFIKGDVEQGELAVNRLKWLPFVPQSELRKIVVVYATESNLEKKEVLKRAYKDLTGEDIELRQLMMND
jgi:hypothetical protein